jgi:hypothetical protein
MLVPLIYLHSTTLARTALDYRKLTLPAAFKKYQMTLAQKQQRSSGAQGVAVDEGLAAVDAAVEAAPEAAAEDGPAWFAWESAATGADQLLVSDYNDPYAMQEVQ